MISLPKLSVVRHLALGIALAVPSTLSIADGEVRPRAQSAPDSRIQVAVKGTGEELKAACAFLQPRLDELKKLGVEYLDGCRNRTRRSRSIVFIFSPDHVLANPGVLENFARAFEDQVRRYPVPAKNFSFLVSQKACLRKVTCEGADRWWPCQCP